LAEEERNWAQLTGAVTRVLTALAVLAMALGSGANTAVFTVVNGVLLRPLPLVQRLFPISYMPRVVPFAGRPSLSDHDYVEFQRRTHAFECVTTFYQDEVTLTGAGDAIRLHAAVVTPSFFPVLRVSPAIGRTFASQEEQPGAPGVAVLSQELWRSRFAADPNILGKAIAVDGIKRSVIGVMPAGFAFPGDARLWLPLAVDGAGPTSAFWPAFGRLRPSVTQRQAQAELEALAPHLSMRAMSPFSAPNAMRIPTDWAAPEGLPGTPRQQKGARGADRRPAGFAPAEAAGGGAGSEGLVIHCFYAAMHQVSPVRGKAPDCAGIGPLSPVGVVVR